MRPIAIALLLAGCATPQPPRPLPKSDWQRGVAITVQPPRENLNEEWRQSLKDAIEDDLRTAGMRVLAASQGKGEMHVVLTYAGDGKLTVAVDMDDELVARSSFREWALPCVPNLPDALIYGRCIGREVAARVLESPELANAISRRPSVPAAARATRTGKLAVLELRNFAKDLTKENAQYFTDVVRSAALNAQPQLEVMTRENLLVLLKASGKSLEECEGECEVDTGRRIGADQIVSGEIQRLGTKYKLSLRLHDTHEGRLLASAQASGATIDELDADAQRAARELLTAR